jgi:hypothetical protein
MEELMVSACLELTLVALRTLRGFSLTALLTAPFFPAVPAVLVPFFLSRLPLRELPPGPPKLKPLQERKLRPQQKHSYHPLP